jgi:hypothetical protein
MQSVGQWIRCRFQEYTEPETASLWPTPKTNAIQRTPETRSILSLTGGNTCNFRNGASYDDCPED